MCPRPGLLTQTSLPRSSDIVREVLRPKMPAFLVLQIVFHIGCLSLSLIKTFAIAYDVTEAKVRQPCVWPSPRQFD